MMHTRSEFEQSLTQQKLLPVQIIYGSLTMSILLFALVVFVLLSGTPAQDPAGTDIIMLLSVVHGLMMLTVYSVAPLIFKKQLVGATSSPSPSGPKVLSAITGKIITAYIIRLAMYEGVAIFGLVVCLLTVQWGHYPFHAEFLYNGLSSFFFLVMAITTFPTRDRLGNTFSRYYQ